MRRATFLLILLLSPLSWSNSLEVGHLAPNWLLKDSKLEPVVLHQQTDAGNDVVMIFWASWCSVCEVLLPQLNALKDKLQAKNLAIKFYALHVWDDSDPTPYIKGRKLNFKTLHQADNVAQRYGIKLSPGIVVVGKDKRIKYKADAATSPEKMIEELEILLMSQDAETTML